MSEIEHIYIVDDDDSMRATLLRAFEKQTTKFMLLRMPSNF